MKRFLAFLFLISITIAGCNAGEVTKEMNVELDDFTFSPNQFKVQSGSEVAINVTNSGAVKHDFNIMKLGADVGDTFDDKDRENVLLEMSVQSGETESETFSVPAEAGK